MAWNVLRDLGPCALAAIALAGEAVAQDAPRYVGPVARAQSLDEAVWVGDAPYRDGFVIVRFAATTDPDAAASELLPARYRLERRLMRRTSMYSFEILDGTPVPRAVEELSRNPLLLWAQADHLVSDRQDVPNDTEFGLQWNMRNLGGFGQVFDADVDGPEAWEISTGSTAFVVAIIDSGIELTHSDLSANNWINFPELVGSPFVDDDGNGYLNDINGWDAYGNDPTLPSSSHGTRVAGVVGAVGDNGLGVAGVNWTTRMMYIAGSSSTTSTVMAAYDYVIANKQNGVNVVATNSSFGIDGADCSSSPYPAWNTAYNDMGALGILSAAATTNNNWDVDVTGDVPTGCTSSYLIAVTTTDDDDDHGPRGYGTVSVDLGAPGESVRTTYTGNTYTTTSGTSFASPHVAGAVALMHAAASSDFTSYYASSPSGAALTLKQLLLDNVDPNSDLAGISVSGGRLDLNAAVQAIACWSSGDDIVDLGGGCGDGGEALVTCARQGNSGFRHRLTGASPSSTVFFVLSPEPLGASCGPCTIFVDPATAIVFPGFTDVAGDDTVFMPIPNQPGVVGLSFVEQWVVLDASPACTAFGIDLSNGLRVTIE